MQEFDLMLESSPDKLFKVIIVVHESEICKTNLKELNARMFNAHYNNISPKVFILERSWLVAQASPAVNSI